MVKPFDATCAFNLVKTIQVSVWIGTFTDASLHMAWDSGLVAKEFLRVVDHKQVIFKITERVMRAVLVSAMKMSAFHVSQCFAAVFSNSNSFNGYQLMVYDIEDNFLWKLPGGCFDFHGQLVDQALFTWLLYSFGQLPIVVVPTVLSAILALVPKVSPVWSVSFWAAGYLWLHGHWICAAVPLGFILQSMFHLFGQQMHANACSGRCAAVKMIFSHIKVYGVCIPTSSCFTVLHLQHANVMKFHPHVLLHEWLILLIGFSCMLVRKMILFRHWPHMAPYHMATLDFPLNWSPRYLLLNLAVWWQVPTVIYAEIPEANAWLTGLGVVLGVGQFGLAGVVLGPLLASVPLICHSAILLGHVDQGRWRIAGFITSICLLFDGCSVLVGHIILYIYCIYFLKYKHQMPWLFTWLYSPHLSFWIHKICFSKVGQCAGLEQSCVSICLRQIIILLDLFSVYFYCTNFIQTSISNKNISSKEV